MAEHIHQCNSCRSYTLEKKCPSCGEKTASPKPPKFSLDDKYAELRRKVKKEELVKKGLF